jgi:soluble lytic murein transglycosylase-like protein
MTNFPRVIFFLALFAIAIVPALGQSSNYSFDNFDTRSGVRVYVEQAQTPPKGRIRRNSRTAGANRAIASNPNRLATIEANPLRPLVRPTLLTYPTVNMATSAGTSLRGFTTGSSEIDSYIVSSGSRYGVDPLLLYSIMHQESSFKGRAISPKGARGLMQLMPMTAIRYGVTNIFDPKQNIEGGTRYMAFLLDHFNNDLSLALAGYNAGEGAVEKYGWRVPPYSETQEYVRRITRRYSLLRDPNAVIYAPRLNQQQVATIRGKQAPPLTIYERSVLTVRLPDGRLQLLSQ